MLRVFGNSALSNIYGSKRDEVTGEKRRLHNEELNYLYWLTNIIRAIKFRRMICVGPFPGAFRVLVETPEGQKTTGKAWE